MCPWRGRGLASGSSLSVQSSSVEEKKAKGGTKYLSGVDGLKEEKKKIECGFG